MAAKARLTGLPVEALVNLEAKARLTGLPIEALVNLEAKARLSGLPIEALVNLNAKARLSGLVIEVLYNEQVAEPASNTITFSQSATAQLIASRSPTNTITFSNTASAVLIEQPGSLIIFSQSVALEAILNKSVTSTLSFGQSVIALPPNKILVNATSVLAFTQVANPYRAAKSTLAFTQSATNILLKTASPVSTITFAQSTALNYTLQRPVQNILVLSHAASANVIRQLSASNILIFNQRTLPVPLIPYFIIESPTDSIVLPNPELSDTRNLLSDLSLYRSINGETYTYVKRTNLERFNFTFRMDNTKADQFKDFINSNHSKELLLKNWKGEFWKGWIVTNPVDFIQNSRTQVDVDLEFNLRRYYG